MQMNGLIKGHKNEVNRKNKKTYISPLGHRIILPGNIFFVRYQQGAWWECVGQNSIQGGKSFFLRTRSVSGIKKYWFSPGAPYTLLANYTKTKVDCFNGLTETTLIQGSGIHICRGERSLYSFSSYLSSNLLFPCSIFALHEFIL